jgi:hypothetical protein
MFHLDPSQFSIRVWIVPYPDPPTAQQSLAEAHVTPLKELVGCEITGDVSMVQAIPLKCSISG